MNDQEDVVIERPPPPPHLSSSARQVHTPEFKAFKPKECRFPNHSQGMNFVSWSCDGKKLAAVGMDKIVRVWNSDKVDPRAANVYSHHSDDVDYVVWNPTHPDLFCSSSQKDRKIIFWDARQNRAVQTIILRGAPAQLQYSPDGQTLMYSTIGGQLHFLTLNREADPKEQWKVLDKEQSAQASAVLFNHTGTGIVAAHVNEHTLRFLDYPSLKVKESLAAHITGCGAIALDPRGRYLASGGHDSHINLYDLSTMLCSSTITSTEHSITALSFSYDGEYLAIASAGKYIDIVATETGIPLHRIPISAPSPTVAWHPSSFCLAYCGHIVLPNSASGAAIIGQFGVL